MAFDDRTLGQRAGGLISQTGQGSKGLLQSLMSLINFANSQTPVAKAGRLAGAFTDVVPGNKQSEQGALQGLQDIALKDPFIEGALAARKKAGGEMQTQAIQQIGAEAAGQSLQDMMKQREAFNMQQQQLGQLAASQQANALTPTGLYQEDIRSGKVQQPLFNPATQQLTQMPGIAQPGQAQGANPRDRFPKVINPQGLGQSLFGASSIDPVTGDVRAGGFFNAFTGPTLNDLKLGQDIIGAQPGTGLQEKIAEAELVPFGKARKGELAMEGTNSLMTKIASLQKGVGGDAVTRRRLNEGISLTSDLDTIENEFARSLGKGAKGGFIGQTLKGGIIGLGRKINLAQNVKTYDDFVSAIATKYGKFVGEDRFTEQDRKVFRQIFPGTTTSPAEVKTRFAIIRSTVNSHLNAMRSGQQTSFSAVATDLMDRVKEARAEGYSEEDIQQFVIGGIS